MRFLSRLSPPVLACSGVLLASLLLPLPQDGAILNLPSPCPFFHLTGLPCPGCGLTRSFVCCGHGQIAAAFGWHLLGPFLYAATLIFVIGSLTGTRLTARYPNFWLGLSGVLFFAFWLLRLGGVFPMPAA